jgi:hypothetical protein
MFFNPFDGIFLAGIIAVFMTRDDTVEAIKTEIRLIA